MPVSRAGSRLAAHLGGAPAFSACACQDQPAYSLLLLAPCMQQALQLRASSSSSQQASAPTSGQAQEAQSRPAPAANQPARPSSSSVAQPSPSAAAAAAAAGPGPQSLAAQRRTGGAAVSSFVSPWELPEQEVAAARARIFGKPIGTRERSGRRVLARALQGPQLSSWYFLPPKEVPGFHNEERE